MKSNFWLFARTLISTFGLMLVLSACDNPASNIPASKTETVTDAMYDQIEIGMTLEEINTIIGFPGQDTQEQGTPFITYVWGSGLGKHIQVDFSKKDNKADKAVSVVLFEGRKFIKRKP